MLPESVTKPAEVSVIAAADAPIAPLKLMVEPTTPISVNVLALRLMGVLVVSERVNVPALFTIKLVLLEMMMGALTVRLLLPTPSRRIPAFAMEFRVAFPVMVRIAEPEPLIVTNPLTPAAVAPVTQIPSEVAAVPPRFG